MTDYDRLIFDLRLFADEYIVYDSPQMSIVNRGNKLINKVHKLQGKYCCPQAMPVHAWCELEYWSEIVRLIIGRIKTLNKKKRIKSSCESYSSFRYEYIGLPHIQYPNSGVSVIKMLTFFFLAVSGIVQLVRVQTIDDKVSFWAQAIYIVGALITVIYFAAMKNLDLAYPYIGGIVIAATTIWGLFRHDSQPWLTL